MVFPEFLAKTKTPAPAKLAPASQVSTAGCCLPFAISFAVGQDSDPDLSISVRIDAAVRIGILTYGSKPA